jgi:hypothetical protein
MKSDRIFAILLLKSEGEVREKVEEFFRDNRGWPSAAVLQLKLLNVSTLLAPKAHAWGITASMLEEGRVLPIRSLC